MDTWYWISEYGKVFWGYLFLMLIWPSVVFAGHLRGKSKTYRFSFCVTVPIVIINTTVLTLGLFHGLNQWIIRLIFYGSFIWAFLKEIIPCFKWLKRKRRVRKRDLYDLFWKYGILLAVIIYGMAYFSYGAFQIYSYGYGDLYVHHQWIYGLIEGKIFEGGVYPQAMHCFIYCMHTLFGIRVYSILLFLQVIHVSIFFAAAYLLLRKIFCWRYTPIFVLVLFLILDLCNADLIHSMFRLQITLPLEFGLHTVFLCGLHLMNYFDEKCFDTTKRYWDENLFLFAISLSTGIMTHFHTALMGLIFCISVIVIALKKIFCRRYLIPLAVWAFSSCLIAGIPMAGALARGIPLSSSIHWAVDTMSGEQSREQRGQNEEIDSSQEESGELQNIERNDISITAGLLNRVIWIYEKGYGALYGKERGGWMLLFTLLAAVFCWMMKRKAYLQYFAEKCRRYPYAIIVSVLYILVYAAPMMGFPDIIPEGRFFAAGHMMLLAVMVMPMDAALFSLLYFCSDLRVRIITLLSCLGIYGITVETGNFRGFLYYELSRYNAAAMVTESIINTFPQHSYTIVSPTDELYPVVQYGWHEELLTFVENSDKGSYTLPSEYIFIYVEKRPILYSQSHFFKGPSWMGKEKYLEPFWAGYSSRYPDSAASQAPDIAAGQVSEVDGDKELPEYENAWSMYLKLENRTILESKAYNWCQEFSKRNPSVLNVYYEDEDFVCYYFRQSGEKPLYELGMERTEG